MHRSLILALTLVAAAASPAWAQPAPHEYGTQAHDDPEAENGAAPGASAAPAPGLDLQSPDSIRNFAATQRTRLRELIEKRLDAKDDGVIERNGGAAAKIGLLGFLLVLMPLFLMRKYPGRLWTLTKYSFAAAFTWTLGFLAIAFMVVILKAAEGTAAQNTNPQMQIMETVLSYVEENAEEVVASPEIWGDALRSVGAQTNPEAMIPAHVLEGAATRIRQTAGQMQNNPEDFAPLLNVGTLAFGAIKILGGFLPDILFLVTAALLLWSLKPVALLILDIPRKGVEGVSMYQAMRDVWARIGREVLAVLCMIAVLFCVAEFSGVAMFYSLKSAVTLLLDYVQESVYYVASETGASPLYVLTAFFTSALIISLVIVLATVASAAFLGRVFLLLKQKFTEKVPLNTHMRFWKYGTLSYAWLMVLPAIVLFSAKLIIEAALIGYGDEHSWTLALFVGPLLELALLGLAFFFGRGLSALLFLFRYKHEPIEGSVAPAS